MTPKTPSHRRWAAVGLVTALTVTGLTGCAQEDPTHDEVSSSAPTDAAPTTSDADDAVTSGTPDDAGATTADAEETTSSPTETETADPTTLGASDESFEIEVPATWEDALDLVADDGVLLAAKDTERVDDFFTNVVVTTEKSVEDLPASVERAAEELAGEDGEHELLEAVEVDGEEAPGLTIVREVDGTQVHQTQRWINHGDALYVVTFSAVQSRAEDVAPVLDDILASWTWAD